MRRTRRAALLALTALLVAGGCGSSSGAMAARGVATTTQLGDIARANRRPTPCT